MRIDMDYDTPNSIGYILEYCKESTKEKFDEAVKEAVEFLA